MVDSAGDAHSSGLESIPVGPDPSGSYKILVIDNLVEQDYTFKIAPTIKGGHVYDQAQLRTISVICGEYSPTINDSLTETKVMFVRDYGNNTFNLGEMRTSPPACPFETVEICMNIGLSKVFTCTDLPQGLSLASNFSTTVDYHTTGDLVITLDPSLMTTKRNVSFFLRASMKGGMIYVTQEKNITVICPPWVEIERDDSKSEIAIFIDDLPLNYYKFREFKTWYEPVCSVLNYTFWVQDSEGGKTYPKGLRA